ncbi:hypothetical protein Tco_0012293 [Tanacetum coccineum]
MNCELCGQNSHLFENYYEVLFCKKCKRTNHRTCDHADFMFSMNANQHHNGQGESSSRSRPTRPSVSFPSCIHYGYNDHHSNDCLYYLTCEICGSYDHGTHGHNRIISLRRGINPRNPQHVTKNCETCGSNVHTTSDHNDIEWFRKRETLQAKNVESFKESKNDSSNALRSKTPTKRYINGTPSLGLQQACWDLKDFKDSYYCSGVKDLFIGINKWYQSLVALDLGSTRFIDVNSSREEWEMITSQLQGKLWLYDEVRTRLGLFCHHQIGEDYWDSRFDETK